MVMRLHCWDLALFRTSSTVCTETISAEQCARGLVRQQSFQIAVNVHMYADVPLTTRP